MKPILIVKLPHYLEHEDEMRIFNTFKKMDELNKNYIIIMVSSKDLENFEFQGLYPKDFDEKSFDELKEILKDKVKIL